MFVRFKTRRRTVGRERGSVTLTAVLLESRRIDGRPRQRYVAGLGTLSVQVELHQIHDPEEYLRVDGGFVHSGAVIGFWRHLADRLDGLDLAPQQRQSIESKIASRIPRATDVQRLANDEKLKEMVERMEKLTS